MDWTTSNSLKRRSRRSAQLGKSTSEPNLSGHFTPRFPDNLAHLLHEYVTVDELKFYRKRRPPNIDDEFHSKETICLYDRSQPIIPFAALKSEYTKEFGKTFNLRSRSVPNRIDLNVTTKELLDALKDDSADPKPSRPRRATTAKLFGEISIEGADDLLAKKISRDLKVSETNKDNDCQSKEETPQENRRTCTFKVQGEVSYSPDLNGDFAGGMEQSEPIARMNSLKFHGKFHGLPEYRDSFKAHNHFARSAPIKARDHLRVSPITVNTAVISPNPSSLSEYTDKYKEIDLRSSERRKLSKQISNVAMRNNLMIGHSDQHVFPEYFETFKDYHIKKPPEKPKSRSPILSLNGSMDYSPEYRVKFKEFPRRRPSIQKPESHFEFFERPRKSSPVNQVIISPKFNPNIAVVEPSQNIHQPPTIDKNPFYLCQPEVRKARHEILIKKRPPSPSQKISTTIRRNGPLGKVNEDDENRRYEERSRIVKTPVKSPIQVLVDDFDEPSIKPTTLLSAPVSIKSPAKYGDVFLCNLHT